MKADKSNAVATTQRMGHNGTILTKSTKNSGAKAAAQGKKAKASMAVSTYVELMKKQGDEIAAKEEEYQERFVRKASVVLYALLQEIMAFAEQVMESKHSEKVVEGMRHTLKHSYHINTQKNASPLNHIVRYVTRTSRKNSCVYAKVIEKAMADGVRSEGLIDYIKANEGIEKIRKTIVAAKKAESAIEKNQNLEAMAHDYQKLAKVGMSYLNHRNSKGIGSFVLNNKYESHLSDASRETEFKYFACKYANGKYVVIDVVPANAELEERLLSNIVNYIASANTASKDEIQSLKLAAEELKLTLKSCPVARY